MMISILKKLIVVRRQMERSGCALVGAVFLLVTSLIVFRHKKPGQFASCLDIINELRAAGIKIST